MPDRRRFLAAMGYPAVTLAAGIPLRAAGIPRALAAAAARSPASPKERARDEAFWFEISQAFDVDRSLVNLNNGGVCPAPRSVQDSLRRNLELSNSAPAYAMWQLLQPRKETARAGLAKMFGADPEEIAITRNASESLEILQLGLPLARGDEVLTTDQDYPRMLTTFGQRGRREGIVLTTIPIPVPCEDPEEIVRRFEEKITARTRLLLCCHVINLTGQILPVREIVAMARRRGIPAIVDGAHAFAHLAFTRDDLDCDFYGVSLHKWLLAPVGTGLLYVRRERIREVWPLMAAPPEMDADIRKFEEIGTYPVAIPLGIAHAIAFHEGIGAKTKEARLLYLRDRWAKRLLAASDRVRLHTSLAPGRAAGFANVEIVGVDTPALQKHLWEKHRIFTVAIEHPQFRGLRISPNVYTTLREIDLFGDAMEEVARRGL